MNKNGFLLIDSLITVCLVVILSALCLNIYEAVNNYKEGYDNYQIEIADQYETIYSKLGECERCIISEEDLSNLEQ